MKILQLGNDLGPEYNIAGSLWPLTTLAPATNTGESSFIKLTNRSGYDLTYLVVDFCNFYTQSTGDTLTSLDTIVINCAVAYPTVADVTRVATESTLAPGEYKSFRVTVNIAAGASFYICTDVRPQNGGRYPQAYSGLGGSAGASLSREEYTSPTPPSIKASAGVAISPTAGTMTFSPVAVRSRTPNKFSLCVIGDSWVQGSGAGAFGSDFSPGLFGIATGGVCPYIHHGIAAASVAQNNTELALRYRLQIAKKAFSHVMLEWGVNDMTFSGQSTPTIKANLLAVANLYSLIGVKPLGCTVGPHTGSTDTWDTIENQTKTAYIADSFGTTGSNSLVLQEVNDWLRTVPTPYWDYFDLADAMMNTRNSALWNINLTWASPSYTNDGLHPSAVNTSLRHGAVYVGADALILKLNAWKAAP